MDLSFITHKESYLLVDESYNTGERKLVVEIPNFKTGSYTLTLFEGSLGDDTVDNELEWSFTIQRVGQTINVTYGRSIPDTLLEFRVAKDGNIHIVTRYGRKLYYFADTVEVVTAPETYADYPYTDDQYIYNYICEKDSSNIYTSWNGIEVFGEEGVGGDSELTLTKTNNLTDVSVTTRYSPVGGSKVYRVYTPDQEVNTASKPHFSSISLDGMVPGNYLRVNSDGTIGNVNLEAQFCTNEHLDEVKEGLEHTDYLLSQRIVSAESSIASINNTTIPAVREEISNAETRAKAYTDTEVGKEKKARESDIDDVNGSISELSDNLSSYKTTANNRMSDIESDLTLAVSSLTSKIEILESMLESALERIEALENGKADKFTVSAPLVYTNDVISIDESNIVHKSGNETITGLKTVNGGMVFNNVAPIIPTNPSNKDVDGALWYD